MKAKAVDDLLDILRTRFEQHPSRHKGIVWSEVAARVTAQRSSVEALAEMERTGGEPDVVDREKKGGAIVFMDCSAESPAGRRSVCFDREGWESRKENRPQTSALEMAAAMGVALLTEAEYRQLQTLGAFDTKTSSWVQTPASVRALGGALFCDRRYDQVFVYHNGAQSYYAARGFRASLRV